MTGVKIIGKLNWRQLRATMLDKLEDVKTEKQLEDFLGLLYSSMGTKKQCIKIRKQLGEPFDDLEDLEC